MDLDDLVADVQEYKRVRSALGRRLSMAFRREDIDDAIQDCWAELNNQLSRGTDVGLAIHIAARRKIDSCSVRRVTTTKDGRRRERRICCGYRPSRWYSPETTEEQTEEDDRDGVNQPRDWTLLTLLECAEAGLMQVNHLQSENERE